TIIESSNTVVFGSLNDTIENSIIVNRFVHHTGLHDIKGRADTGGIETSHHGADKVKHHCVRYLSVLKEHLLILIVTSNLSCVDHRVSQDIGEKTNPETTNSISSDDLSIAIESALVSDRCRVNRPVLCLQSDLDDISRVSEGYSNGSCTQTRQDLSTK